jgi:hypothetical protein
LAALHSSAILLLPGAAPSRPQARERGVISDRTMFQIYREGGYGRRFRVVYFTELNDHNRETEISRAMAGEHLYDGFLKDYGKEEAKQIIARFVEQLNRGESPALESLRSELAPYAG